MVESPVYVRRLSSPPTSAAAAPDHTVAAVAAAPTECFGASCRFPPDDDESARPLRIAVAFEAPS